MDNNNNRQNADRFTPDGRLNYHWGADDEILEIINRRDNSLETKELIQKRIELTRPGHMRHQWHKKLERDILLPRRPDDVDKKEIKRIDIRLGRKEQNRVRHIGGSHIVLSKTFGTKSHKHPAHQLKLTQKPSPSKKPHRIPNLRSPHHQTNQ